MTDNFKAMEDAKYKREVEKAERQLEVQESNRMRFKVLFALAVLAVGAHFALSYCATFYKEQSFLEVALAPSTKNYVEGGIGLFMKFSEFAGPYVQAYSEKLFK